MWVLLSVLMIGVPGSSTSLVNLQGKWTVGLGMRSFLAFNQYSVLWKPFKTVMIGIEGNGRLNKDDTDYESWSWSAGIGLYKYFRASSSFSPFIALSPRFSMSSSYYGGENWHKYSYQTYRVSLDPGIECFFSLMGKQLSLRFKTSLVGASRYYTERKYYNGENYSDVKYNVHFYFPMEGSLSTWLCFHF
ncbi:hypothetical protein KAW50_00490 [candidate division WOR-3 bacterium]|nr:hypothetical protein [candidate division WOR-3 bacterium]